MKAMSRRRVPGPNTEVTQLYHFPPARPDAPAAARCTREQLVQIAADAADSMSDLHALVSSPEHVRRMCELLVELAGSDQRVAGLERDLEAVQDRHVGELAERARDEALRDGGYLQ